jgi:hypothetical protein
MAGFIELWDAGVGECREDWGREDWGREHVMVVIL